MIVTVGQLELFPTSHFFILQAHHVLVIGTIIITKVWIDSEDHEDEESYGSATQDHEDQELSGSMFATFR